MEGESAPPIQLSTVEQILFCLRRRQLGQATVTQRYSGASKTGGGEKQVEKDLDTRSYSSSSAD